MTKKSRFPAGSVCKPCWELRYCPYGPIVEFFPLPYGKIDLEEVRGKYQEAMNVLLSGSTKTEEEVWSAVERLFYFVPDSWEFVLEHGPDEIGCKECGHVCPVFFSQSGATETKDARKEGRFIPRDIMLKVVRRDAHVCQVCHKYVPDEEVEFDHVIPYSKGGPTSVDNLRLLCRACNRKKGATLGGILRNGAD